MAQKIQFRRGTAAEWTSANPILAEGELGVEIDTQLYKIGNGIDTWVDLYYGGLNPELGIVTFEAQVSEPSAAVAGTGKLYAKSMGGRILPKFIGPAGIDTSLQPSFFGNGIQMYLPGASTAPNVIGGPALTAVGTLSHPTLVSTNIRTQTSRFNVVSATGANSAAEARSPFARIWRGDSAGLGGFFHRTRFAFSTAAATQRSFFGFTSSTTAISTSQEPSVLTNMFGIGNGLNQTTLRVYGNDGAGTATEVDLGVNFPANDTTTMYDFTVFHAPNGSSLSWEVVNLKTNAVATGTISSADLPISTTFLAYHAYMNNGGTSGAVGFDIIRIYTETDY
jgi:hypothetical protein